MKKKSIVLLTILILLLAFVAGAFLFVKSLANPVVKGESGRDVRIEIPDGMSVYKVSILLKNEGLIKSDKLFYYSARFPKINRFLFPSEEAFDFTLRSGIYHIQDNMNIVQIQRVLSSGQQEYIKISIPEGYTISQIAEVLEEGGICAAESFKEICHNSTFQNLYGIPGDSVEGYLFPDTYFLIAGMDAKAVAKIMIDNFYSKIAEIPVLAEMNAAELFYAVRLASIVEREYAVEDEAPLIASVFKNRLKKNIGLYSCATIVYILTEIEGRPHPDRILISDTKIDNPYNTYKWAGLPPGAISNPGLVALKAVADTPKTNYYFFQVVDASEGRHIFTSNFEDHVENHITVNKKARK